MLAMVTISEIIWWVGFSVAVSYAVILAYVLACLALAYYRRVK